MTAIRILALRCVTASLALALVVVTGLMTSPAGAADTPMTLRIHHWNSPVGGAHRKFLVPWSKKIMERTNGAVKIEVYPSMQLGGSPRDLYNQARDGVVDMIWTIAGYQPGRFPRTEAFTLPFVSGTGAVTSAAVMDFWQSTDWLKQEYSETVPILFYAAESAAIHSRQPIRKLDDLAGIKIRAPSRLIAQSMKRLGATVVGIPTPEVVPAIQRGIIDGSATSWAMGKTFKQCDVTKYSTDIPGFASVVFIFVMNKRTWTQLPEEVQKVIREESTVDYARSLGKIWDEDDNGGRNYCKNSSEIIELPAAERQRWEKAMQPEIDGWVAAISEKQRINGAALVDDVRKFMKKHNAGKP